MIRADQPDLEPQSKWWMEDFKVSVATLRKNSPPLRRVGASHDCGYLFNSHPLHPCIRVYLRY